jgi:hypothetical protein
MPTFRDGFMVSDVPKQGCSEPLPEQVFWMDEEGKQLSSPSSIIGYLIRMTQAYLAASDTYKKVQVKPSINDEYFENFGDPLVTIRRGQVQPENLGIMGGKTPLPKTFPDGIPGFDDKYPNANFLDSNKYTDLVQMVVMVNLYAATLAECENIGFMLYRLFMASGADVLKGPFPFIQFATFPTMTPTEVMEKHDDIYMLSLQWAISYWDDSIVLVRKNVIKYATIIVRDEPVENVIYRENNEKE